MRQPIPFGNNQPSVDIPGFSSTYQTGPYMRDVYVDLKGNIVKRPVLQAHADTGESDPVNGLYWWDEQGLVMAVSGGELYKANENGITYTKITNDDTLFGTSARVSWGNYGNALYASNGGKPKKITTATIADMADTPTDVYSLAVKDKYLILVDDGTGNFYWSTVGDPDDFTDGYYAESELNPDNLLSIWAQEEHLFMFGKRSGEVWYNDGVTPWARLTQGSFGTGSISRWAPFWCDAINTFVWVTPGLKLVKLEGRQAVSLSPSLDQYLSFCRGWGTHFGPGRESFTSHYFVWDGIPFYLLTDYNAEWGESKVYGSGFYPGMSVVVNLITGDWYEWCHAYDDGTNGVRYLAFQVASIAATPFGTFVGDAKDGLIHILDRSGSDDNTYGDIAPSIRSSISDRGDSNVEKICKSLSFTFKIPETNSSTSFSISVTYSDNGGLTWSSARTVAVTVTSGTRVYVAQSYNWGSYYARQWKIDFDSTGEVALGPVMEDFEYVY